MPRPDPSGAPAGRAGFVSEVDTTSLTGEHVRFRPARRLRGDRYVTGAMRYLDDATPSRCLHVIFLRSPHAHARILRIDTSAASRLPGVHAVLTGQDTRHLIADLVCQTPSALTGTLEALTLPCLPADFVRYAGEPVALVVGDSEAVAREGARLVDVAYEPLAPLLDTAAATAPGARAQRPELPGNVLMSGVVRDGDAAAAFRDVLHTVTGRIALGRGSAVPLEPRGCVAGWDVEAERLIVRASVQAPHGFRAELARQLNLPENGIQVVAPALGGAFGFKFTGLPEEPLTCLAAMRLKQAVRWVETREEALLVGAREYAASYRLGFDGAGKVTALSVELEADVGALCATPGPLMPFVAATTFPGPYDIANVDVRWRAVMTNKGPWNGARGFGKEATCAVLEAAMDDVARALGRDPLHVRQANLLRREQFPHRTSTMTVDSGDYHAALDRLVAMSGYAGKRRRARPAGTVRTGLGIAFELTPEGFDSGGSLARGFETATVRLDTGGAATVLTGVTSPGTGSETAIAELVAERLGLQAQDVRVVQGDTDTTPYGSGTFSSRAVMVGGMAAWLAAGDLRAALTKAAATLMGATPEDIELAEGHYRLIRSPVSGIAAKALPRMLRTLGGALPGIGPPQLEATRTYGPQNLQSVPDLQGRLQIYPTYSYSAHMAEVEVDTQTGTVRLVALSAVHDCGTVVNQALVDAQLHGAIAMGAGMALFEEEIFDPEGTPRSIDLKHYLWPRVTDLPKLLTGHLCSPSPFTELGTKGAGESGVGGAAAAIVGAVRDALGGAAGVPIRTPLTPTRVLALIDHAGREVAG